MQTHNTNLKLDLLKDPQTLLDYVGGTDPIYIGKSFPGAATSEPQWQIQKLTYDGNGNVTSVKLSDGTPNPDSVWDNRASLSYS